MPFAVAAGVLAVGAVVQGVTSAHAANNAADAQVASDASAQQIQRDEFNTIQSEYAPQRNLGYGADALLGQLFGMPNPNTSSSMYPANGVSPSLTNAPSANTPQAYGNGVIGDVFSRAAGGGGGGGGGFAPGAFGTGTGVAGGTASSAPRRLTVDPNGQSVATAPGSADAPGAAGAAGGANGLPSNAPPGASSQFSNFYNSPGYQFALQQGEQGINRNAAARGNAYSTSTMTDIGKYAEGAASTQYNNYVSQLLSLAGLGGQATAGTAGAAQNAGNNISSAQLSAGNASASGALANGGAWSSAINGVGKAFTGFGGG